MLNARQEAAALIAAELRDVARLCEEYAADSKKNLKARNGITSQIDSYWHQLVLGDRTALKALLWPDCPWCGAELNSDGSHPDLDVNDPCPVNDLMAEDPDLDAETAYEKFTHHECEEGCADEIRQNMKKFGVG